MDTCLKAATLVATITFLSGQFGCAMFQAHSEHIAYSAQLNDGARVELVQQYRRDALQSGPEHNCSQLWLRLTENDRVLLNADAGRRAGDFSEHPRFDLGPLAGRADEKHKRVWIVDQDNGMVIASLDRTSGDCTGFGAPPPPWATLDGGIALDNQSR